MRTIKTTNNYTVFGEIFENTREMINVIERRTCVDRDIFDDIFQDSYVCDRPSFKGFKTKESLIQDCLSCKVDTSSVQSIQTGLRPSQNITKVKFFNDVAGFKPIVPLALINQPKAMRSQRLVQHKAKVIDLYVNISCCGSYTLSEIERAGADLMTYVLSLEQQGYRVSLTTFWGTICPDRNVSLVGVKVKDSSQPLDIKRCAYPFINPSFHRGICWGWYERTEGFCHSKGFGCPMSKWSAQAQDVKKALGIKNGTVLYFSDILDVGRPYIESTIQMECPQNGPVRA